MKLSAISDPDLVATFSESFAYFCSFAGESSSIAGSSYANKYIDFS